MQRRNIASTFVARRRTGFTLVELLVVVGVIAVLISLLLPALSKAMRAARAAQCLSNLRQVATAMMMYAQDNKGAVPGIEYDSGHVYWATPYDHRPYIGQVVSGIYPTQPAGSNGAGNHAYYSNIGLLCSTGFMQWTPALFCPGRESSDGLSWESQSFGVFHLGSGDKTVGGYNPGWFIYSGTGSSNTYAGYLVATTNRSQGRLIDFGKAHRLGRCSSETPLVMDIFWWGEGATMEGHGQGYNIATFDGSARWYPDPGYRYTHTSADYHSGTGDVPTYPVETTFQGPAYAEGTGYCPSNDPGSPTPLTGGWNFPAIAAGTGQNW